MFRAEGREYVLQGGDAIFKGADTTVITQGKACPAYDDYRRLPDTGTKTNLAKPTRAARIAAAVLRMWKDEVSRR